MPVEEKQQQPQPAVLLPISSGGMAWHLNYNGAGTGQLGPMGSEDGGGRLGVICIGPMGRRREALATPDVTCAVCRITGRTGQRIGKAQWLCLSTKCQCSALVKDYCYYMTARCIYDKADLPPLFSCGVSQACTTLLLRIQKLCRGCVMTRMAALGEYCTLGAFSQTSQASRNMANTRHATLCGEERENPSKVPG